MPVCRSAGTGTRSRSQRYFHAPVPPLGEHPVALRGLVEREGVGEERLQLRLVLAGERPKPVYM